MLDGPSSGVLRGVRNLKDLHLTKQKISIRVGQRTKKVQAAYDKAKEELDKATDASTSNYAKKRSMASEVKHFREQKEEVKQWEKLNREKVRDM